jgi:hypothetical protein
MKVVISQPMFFPWVGFFEQIKLSDIYVHYNDVQYSKGGFTNRVQVKSPEGIKWLTVPLKNLHLGQVINQVEVNNQQNWRDNHFDLLKRSYEMAPYYSEMLKLVETVYSRDWLLLDDLSQATLHAVCDYFDFFRDRNFICINDLNVGGASSERVLATTLKLGADTYITGHGASKYLNHGIFEDAGVRVEYMNYQKKPYPQLYGEFTPYVSILDLIANVGKEGVSWICSGTIYWKDFVNE